MCADCFPLSGLNISRGPRSLILLICLLFNQPIYEEEEGGPAFNVTLVCECVVCLFVCRAQARCCNMLSLPAALFVYLFYVPLCFCTAFCAAVDLYCCPGSAAV